MQISQKIIDYAIWYYLRYYPSKNFLSKKLREKFGPDSEKGKKYG
jgi:transposase-like protein